MSTGIFILFVIGVSISSSESYYLSDNITTSNDTVLDAEPASLNNTDTTTIDNVTLDLDQRFDNETFDAAPVNLTAEADAAAAAADNASLAVDFDAEPVGNLSETEQLSNGSNCSNNTEDAGAFDSEPLSNLTTPDGNITEFDSEPVANESTLIESANSTSSNDTVLDTEPADDLLSSADLDNSTASNETALDTEPASNLTSSDDSAGNNTSLDTEPSGNLTSSNDTEVFDAEPAEDLLAPEPEPEPTEPAEPAAPAEPEWHSVRCSLDKPCDVPDVAPGFEREWECTQPLELALAVDVSQSIWRRDFDLVKESLISFLERFIIGPSDTRVAMIPFETDIHPQYGFELSSTDTAEDVTSRLSNLPHVGLDLNRPASQLYTHTYKALQYLRTDLLAKPWVRPDVGRAALVVTDGNSQMKSLTETEATALRDSGVDVYAVGFGRGINMEELIRIAGSEDHVRLANDAAGLHSAMDRLGVKHCQYRDVPVEPII